jgi:hypothetical protein
VPCRKKNDFVNTIGKGQPILEKPLWQWDDVRLRMKAITAGVEKRQRTESYWEPEAT